MSPTELAAIAARAEAASPDGHWGQKWDGTLGRGEIRIGPQGAPATARFMFTAFEFGNAGTVHPDFILAISAPTDVRALLKEIERLRGLMKQGCTCWTTNGDVGCPVHGETR